MSKLIKNGKNFNVAEIEGTYEQLPLGVYNLNLCNSGYYLTKQSDFVLPDKIYGDMSVVDRWLKTYNTKKRNVGVLLAGLKGGGKTITAKLLAIKANKPIININQPYGGTEFIDFITNKVLGDCVIFIDEYEKIYSNQKGETTDSLLSLLDGPYETHHLFIFTVNETTINSNMMNRPSRILYSKKYEGLGEEDIEEIANDLLVNKKHMDDLLRTTKKIFQLSYDVLISIIDEVNRFDEPASECIQYMNLTPDKIRFDIKQWVKRDGALKDLFAGYNRETSTSQDGSTRIQAEFEYYIVKKGRAYPESNSVYVSLNINDAEKISKSSYEIYDDRFKTSYVLTENIQRNAQGSYTYSYTPPIQPKHNVGEMLTIYLDEEGNYIKHTPEYVKISDITEVTGLRIKGMELNESKNLFDSSPLWEDSSDDCCECAG